MIRCFAAVSLCLVIIGAGCFRWSGDKKQEPSGESSGGIPFQDLADFVPLPDEPAPAPDDLEPPTADPTVKTGEIASASGNIVVSSVVPDQVLPNPFVILGRARAFESVVNWRVLDQRREELASGSVMTNAREMGEFGSFRARAFFDRVPDVERGFAEVYTLSPRDGSEQDMVSVPVRFDTGVIPLKVYFSNLKEDPNVEFCDRVYAVTRRVAKTQNTAEAAILELLKGPTTAEQTFGSRTSIFPGTVLRSIGISGGTATVDFSKEFTYAIAGSCHVQAIAAQVMETLKQFPSVESVKVKVEGEDAELEP
jgi:hypothetical protein